MKLLTSILAAIVLFVSFPADSFAVWFDASWTYRIAITVDADQVPSTQTSFPVYVDLSDLPSDFHTNVKSDGCDIRMVESDETTETAFELVDYDDTADTGELHFMADSIDGTTDTTFYIYYGNASASCYGVTDTYGRNAVWSDYIAIWHNGGASIDSTGNGHTGTANGGVTVGGATGVIGAATDYDGTDDYVTVADAAALDPAAITVSAWADADVTSSRGRIVDKLNYSVPPVDGYVLEARLDQAGNPPRFDFGGTGGSGALIGTSDMESAFTLLHATVESGTQRLYANSVIEASDTQSVTLDANALDLQIAGQAVSVGATLWNGRIAEIRLRANALSQNWITTEYNNQNSPSTFYIVGTQETDTGGARKRAIQIIGWYSNRLYA